MKCTALYKTYAGENSAPRPGWFSRELCLNSFIHAFRQLVPDVEKEFILLHDGPLMDGSRWSEFLKGKVTELGTIMALPKSNNAIAHLQALKRGCELDIDAAVIFAEDDYLWLPDSLQKMLAALSEVSADYVTGYDHPDRYLPGNDVRHWDPSIYIAGNHHWRAQESTCMTFATRVKVLREDLAIFARYHNRARNVIEDRLSFLDLQGLGRSSGSARRRLVGPIPSLNTHAHLPWLAPVVDWAAAARSVGWPSVSMREP